MGWWGTGRADDVIGDEPADSLGAALADLASDGRPPPTLPALLDAVAESMAEHAGDWWTGAAGDVRGLTAVVGPRRERVRGEGVPPDPSLVDDLSDAFETVGDDYLEALDRLPRLDELLHLLAFVLGDRPDLVVSDMAPTDTILEVVPT